MPFNLLNDPWLPVVRLDGSTCDVSLGTLLAEAHTLRRIVGETPPMTAALHRLVLALAHRVYGPEDRDAWAELWKGEQFPTENTAHADRRSRYLKDHGTRFELFDPERPFFQCPAVAGVATSSAAKLVPHRSVGNNTTLFDHTTAADELVLSPAQAARWLVTLQVYDPGGLKTPYRKEKKSSLAAPGNRIGLVLVEGGNLKETLLLNMMPYQPENNQPRKTQPGDRPVWEADPPRPEPDERDPFGWTDLLTWPSRRVWLAHRTIGETTVVDRVVITPGTRLRGEPQDNEWMAAYRRPPLIRSGRKATGKTGKPAYGPWYPVRLRENRGVWRHTQELLLAPVGNEERHQQRPGTLEHVADMALRECIPQEAVYTLRVFGQQLDKNATVVQQVLEEAIAAPVALLRAEQPVAGPIIGHSVELADRVGSALVNMERDHRAEFRAAASSNLDLAYWPRLAEPFDAFLRALAPALETGDSLSTAARDWANQVRRIAERAARQWAEGSPRQGRNLEVAGECYGRFLDQLRQFVDTYQGQLAGYTDLGETGYFG